jgi:type II secretory pathway pseudopilin PulG
LEIWFVLSVALLIVLIVLALATVLLWKMFRVVQTNQIRLARSQASMQKEYSRNSEMLGSNLVTLGKQYGKIVESQQRLVSKAMSISASGDPMTFQMVEAMTPDSGYSDPVEHFDPSDAGEVERIAARKPDERDDLNGLEADILASLPEFGIDPAQFQ